LLVFRKNNKKFICLQFFLTERRVACENIDGGHEPSMVPMFWKHRCYRCFTRCFCTSKLTSRRICLWDIPIHSLVL